MRGDTSSSDKGVKRDERTKEEVQITAGRPNVGYLSPFSGSTPTCDIPRRASLPRDKHRQGRRLAPVGAGSPRKTSAQQFAKNDEGIHPVEVLI